MTPTKPRRITAWARRRLSRVLAMAYDYASRDPAVMSQDMGVTLTTAQRAQLAELAKNRN